MKPEFLVSACLAGIPCRFDGASKPHPVIVKLYQSGRAALICPESLAGLPVPREPCEQCAGRIISRDCKDVTEAFQKGAKLAFAKALASGCQKAILKANSPSCGVGRVYDGNFTRTLVPGNGIFAAMLLEAGFEICDENGIEALLAAKRADCSEASLNKAGEERP